MAAIYPKRRAPFDSTDTRARDISPGSDTPGPGAYEAIKSRSMHGLINSDSYIIEENGHRKKRTQPMAM